jgi:hypothetical protein
MPLVSASNDLLPDEFVVLGTASNPKPVHTARNRNTKRAVMKAVVSREADQGQVAELAPGHALSRGQGGPPGRPASARHPVNLKVKHQQRRFRPRAARRELIVLRLLLR